MSEPSVMVFFNDLQEPDVLSADGNGILADLTTATDTVAYVEPNVWTKIVCAWNYFYHRIPITEIAYEPAFRTRSSKHAPKPEIRDVRILPVSGEKQWAVEFFVRATDIDAWECNIGPAATYFDEDMGREYRHIRMSSFTLSSQQPIEVAREALMAS